MAEPEDVLLEGAYAATSMATKLWARKRPGPPRLELAEIRPRLEFLLGALYAIELPIVVAEAPAHPTLLRRLTHRIPPHLLDLRELAGTDGKRVRLPRSIGAEQGREFAFARYRLLAIQQGARAVRGTAGFVHAIRSRAELDLFRISEAVAIDHQLAMELPGLRDDLRRARASALRERPAPRLLTDPEQSIEALLHAVLASDPESIPRELPLAASPEASLGWARRLAGTLPLGPYRGLPHVPYWGRDLEGEGSGADAPVRPGDPEQIETPPAPERVRLLRRRPRVRHAPDDEDDPQLGMWMIQTDDPLEHVEDPMGLQRPTDRDEDADPGDLADSLSELPEARLVNTPGAPREVLRSEDPFERRPLPTYDLHPGEDHLYPEWDCRIEAYRPAGARVRVERAAPGTAEWGERVLAGRATQLRQIRRRFAALRPERMRLARQLDGDEIDLTAAIDRHADLRAGSAGSDRVYLQDRAQRRELAIALLADLSGSTDSWISEHRRIIDVEKEALLLVCQALDAFGDRYGVFGFSGEGPRQVIVRPIKEFSERNGPAVTRKIAGLEPERFTRLGAALRHTNRLLAGERTRHRLLLLLSDGKPNDVDLYEGRYGVEDTRQAVMEARLLGIHPFCLTVDRAAPIYLSRIFGSGYAVLRDAEALPHVLIDVVRRLLHR